MNPTQNQPNIKPIQKTNISPKPSMMLLSLLPWRLKWSACRYHEKESKELDLRFVKKCWKWIRIDMGFVLKWSLEVCLWVFLDCLWASGEERGEQEETER